MSEQVSAETDGIRAYGVATAAIGDVITAASGMNLAANVAVMVPVFGLIGQDFLASFGVAQFNNAASSALLAAVHNGTAAGALAGAEQYDTTDASTATALTSAGKGL
ncbi:type VII secretion target [Gordonia sp. X0973]|uniref:type VII secretion target n=1 Tax=Gordonia sp. X0973 TaxID=2742602 RepID=UPI0026576247|nr:type VII secretion target [Gordonia sp. X0973]